ncbi:NUDIX hydrolase [Micromonospora zhanjiangensis]|uniref:NUDIX hydrolase n=1 Tax=Micromonospora zhanjiangensis TaxID=1522057 RepID=UPI00366AE427
MRAYGPSASFCPRCAEPLPGAPPTVCAGCGYQLFVNARPTVNLVVLDGSRFLALKRAAQPRAGRWETPGGFCDGWEHPTEAAVREGREELGTEIILGDLIGTYVGSYEFQGETLPVLEFFFLATLAGQVRLNPAESSELAWFDLRKHPPLAFGTMDRAIRDLAESLGN